jgi:hypothetical protein
MTIRGRAVEALRLIGFDTIDTLDAIRARDHRREVADVSALHGSVDDSIEANNAIREISRPRILR